MNKRKIINDPLYGFIPIPSDFLFDLIEHPYFQRLRRIKQLGVAEYVYPGALHTRFHHALGAMYLMGQALDVLRAKGHLIWEAEAEAAQVAILLHDVGHGPFSHVLEHTLLRKVPHERLSLLLMHELNEVFEGRLSLAIEMFTNRYERTFFHQLISSQLDVDRLDYLNRDSFFTGVREGNIGAERILKMLDVVDNQLVMEEKAMYSIENFLTARRLMYWQVYLHKTSTCAETMLIQIIRRARDLMRQGEVIFATPAFQVFLEKELSLRDFEQSREYLLAFTQLDDTDLWGSIKVWQHHSDPLLAGLCQMLLHRRLYKIRISDTPFPPAEIQQLEAHLLTQPGVRAEFLPYLLVQGSISNSAYVSGKQNINILTKEKTVRDIAEASDLPTIKALRNVVKKYYVCWAKQGIQ
jgi:uncharacterized protein